MLVVDAVPLSLVARRDSETPPRQAGPERPFRRLGRDREKPRHEGPGWTRDSKGGRPDVPRLSSAGLDSPGRQELLVWTPTPLGPDRQKSETPGPRDGERVFSDLYHTR